MFKCTKLLFVSKLFNSYLHLGKLTRSFEFKYYYSSLLSSLNLRIKDVSLDKYLMYLEKEFDKLKQPVINMEAQQLNRLKQLEPIVCILKSRNQLLRDLDNLKDLLQDDNDEIKQLAIEEKSIYENEVTVMEEQLLEAILPNDVCDVRDSILLEVNTGVGGQEAMLFAKELFYMYCSFAQYKRWNVEVVGYLTTDAGGIRHATALISGKNAYRYFKCEGGVHRVQRIPSTDKMGRTHTSTVSVLVLPEPSDIEVVIDNKDLRIETKRATGAGGQHVNTTDSAVRITHIPSGVAVECQTDRSQIKNKKVAMQKLRSILYDRQLQEQNAKTESTRKSQVKSNFRNEKIRTYNFSQDRITDHRLQNSNLHNLKGFLTGGEALESLMNKLYHNDRVDKLLDTISELESSGKI